MNTKFEALVARNWKLITSLNWVWFFAMCIVALADTNFNFIVGVVLWAIWHMGFYFDDVRPDWSYRRIIAPIWEFFSYEANAFYRTAWKHLLLIGLSLCFVGYGIAGDSDITITLKSPFGIRVVPQDGIALHMPLIENADQWKPDYSASYYNVLLKTQDGKGFSADIEVTLSMDGSLSIQQLCQTYGGVQGYKDAYRAAVLAEFERIAASLTLEQIAYTPSLLLEDHIGTNVGLQKLGLRWSGTIKVTDLHAAASSQ